MSGIAKGWAGMVGLAGSDRLGVVGTRNGEPVDGLLVSVGFTTRSVPPPLRV